MELVQQQILERKLLPVKGGVMVRMVNGEAVGGEGFEAPLSVRYPVGDRLWDYQFDPIGRYPLHTLYTLIEGEWVKEGNVNDSQWVREQWKEDREVVEYYHSQAVKAESELPEVEWILHTVILERWLTRGSEVLEGFHLYPRVGPSWYLFTLVSPKLGMRGSIRVSYQGLNASGLPILREEPDSPGGP